LEARVCGDGRRLHDGGELFAAGLCATVSSGLPRGNAGGEENGCGCGSVRPARCSAEMVAAGVVIADVRCGAACFIHACGCPGPAGEPEGAMAAFVIIVIAVGCDEGKSRLGVGPLAPPTSERRIELLWCCGRLAGDAPAAVVKAGGEG
jgi:hypothetical protein